MRKGVEHPRVFTPPLRQLDETTSLGFAFNEWCREVCEVDLLPWEKWLAVHALEIEGDFSTGWTFRFQVVLVLIARQNGKSLFAELLSLFFMYVLGVQLVLGTAQNLDTAEEVWDAAIERAESCDALAPMVERVRRVNGGKSFELRNNSKYKVVAATRQGARGKRSDLIIMDELREQRTWDGWGAVSKTMMARPNAMLWAFSNAGDAQSVVLRHLRMTAHAECGDPDGIAQQVLAAMPDDAEDETDASTLAIFEWSAQPDCPVDDWDGIAQANPSLGYGFMSERALKSALKTDPESVFRTECLCQWVEAVTKSQFPDDSWQRGINDSSHEDDGAELIWGLDVSADRRKTALAFVGAKGTAWHGEVEAYSSGFDWLLDTLRKAPKPMRIALQGRGAPVSSYIDELQRIDGLEVVLCEGRDVAAWTGRFYDAITTDDDSKRLWHITQPALDVAAQSAQVKTLGDSAWCWDRRKSDCDVAPLIALTMAYGLATVGRTEKQKYKSIYAERGVLTV